MLVEIVNRTAIVILSMESTTEQLDAWPIDLGCGYKTELMRRSDYIIIIVIRNGLECCYTKYTTVNILIVLKTNIKTI